jgi:hypothetical protein
MMQRIVVSTAAVVGAMATAAAAATIALLLTLPSGRAVAQPAESGILPFLQAVVSVLVDAVWAVLEYL